MPRKINLGRFLLIKKVWGPKCIILIRSGTMVANDPKFKGENKIKCCDNNLKVAKRTVEENHPYNEIKSCVNYEFS